MCCFFTVLLFLGPRFANIVWWIIQPGRWVPIAFNNWIWPVLGIIFLPWTTLFWVLVAPGGVGGFEWVWVGLGVLFDVLSYTGGGVGNKDKIPGFGG